LCAECRKTLEIAETVGGVLLEDIPNQQLTSTTLESVFARIDQPDIEGASETSQVHLKPSVGGGSIFPTVLQRYIGDSVENVPWKSIGAGIRQHLIETPDDDGSLRLLRIKAGKAVPNHGHQGRELTLVLSGSYHDGLSTYGAGDMQDVDEEIVHKPIVDEGSDCICLVITDAPIVFKEWMPRLLQPLLAI
jgi:putative transcriptional regulator